MPERRGTINRLRRPAGVLVLLLVAATIRVWTRELPEFLPDASAGLRGVFHIHSDASHDGRVSYAELIAAGHRLEVDFLIFTEHNRQPERSQPGGGLVVVSAAELSTASGHLIQLGLDSVPKKAMRDSSGLFAFLHGNGALAIAAHPESPKRPWTGPDAGLDGFEIASSSADLRVQMEKSYVGLARPLAAYLINPTLALAQMYRRDDAVLARWDARPDPSVFGICGTDTHGWLAPHLQYRSWQVVLDSWNRSDNDVTPDDIIDRLAEGRFICIASLLPGGAPQFRFVAESSGGIVPQGSSISTDSVARITVLAPILADSPATIVLLRDGVPVAQTQETSLVYAGAESGTYRVEIRARIPHLLWGSFEVPVLYSNRIRLH